jgi:hypothetical protein
MAKLIKCLSIRVVWGAASMCLGLLVSSCAGPQNLPYDAAVLATSSEGLSPSAAALLEEAKRHAKTRIGAAATGGLAGIIASVVPSGGASDGLRGALSGAAGGVGATIGYAFGEYIDTRNARVNMDQQKVSMLMTAALNDIGKYERDRANVQAAIYESRDAVVSLNQEHSAKPYPQHVYRRHAQTLSATATVVQMLTQEQRANSAVMSQDILEAQDVKKMGDAEVHPEYLEAQRTRLINEHDGLVSLYGELLAVANAIPAEDRPAVAPIPK